MSTVRKGCFECGLVGEHHDDCSRRGWVSMAPDPVPAPPDYEWLVERIVVGFLVPACHAGDHHERWKAVNRAAGVIAGYAAIFDEELVDRVRLAQSLTDACLERLANSPDQRLSSSDPILNVGTMIAGPNGLPKRVAECLVALGVGR